MDKAIETLLNALLSGGTEILGVLGWGLFLLERYYISPRREAQFRQDLTGFQASYTEFGENVTQALHKFTIVLEVVKDRMR